jgi:hypothetical protein
LSTSHFQPFTAQDQGPILDQPLAAGPNSIYTSMHEINVIQDGYKYTLVVDGLVVLYTSNANIARAYAQEAKRHYITSSNQFVIVPDDPKRVTSSRT